MSKTGNIKKRLHLQKRIFNCIEEIRACEDELAALGCAELSAESDEMLTETLWTNFRLVQTSQRSYHDSLDKFGEDPCFAIAALLEEKLGNIPQYQLLLRGCSIQTGDKSGRFCITGDVAESTAYRILSPRQQCDRQQ